MKSAADFYENKVGEVGASIKDLEAIVQAKTNNVRVVEEGIIHLPLISYLAFLIANTKTSLEAEDGQRIPADTAIVKAESWVPGSASIATITP